MPKGQSAKDKQLNPQLFEGFNKASDLQIWGGTQLFPPASLSQILGSDMVRCW